MSNTTEYLILASIYVVRLLPRWMCLAAVAFWTIMIWMSPAQAAITEPDYANIGGTSYHYDGHGRRWGFNESNPGTGLTWSNVVGGADVSVGHYRNSIGNDSVYVGVQKLPFNVSGGHAGITATLASGYEIPVLPIIAPTICWQYVCALATPPIKGKTVGMASLQFRVPIAH